MIGWPVVALRNSDSVGTQDGIDKELGHRARQRVDVTIVDSSFAAGR